MDDPFGSAHAKGVKTVFLGDVRAERALRFLETLDDHTIQFFVSLP
jgi:hypothetical protein